MLRCLLLSVTVCQWKVTKKLNERICTSLAIMINFSGHCDCRAKWGRYWSFGFFNFTFLQATWALFIRFICHHGQRSAKHCLDDHMSSEWQQVPLDKQQSELSFSMSKDFRIYPAMWSLLKQDESKHRGEFPLLYLCRMLKLWASN